MSISAQVQEPAARWTHFRSCHRRPQDARPEALVDWPVSRRCFVLARAIDKSHFQRRLTVALVCPVELETPDDRFLCASTEPRCNKYLDIDAESRKVSDTTTRSHNSEQTSATVCRHPSRSTSTPIALVCREETITQNPFTDTGDPIHQIPSSNPFSDPSTTTRCSTRQQSSEFSGPSTRFLNISGSSETEEIPLAQRYSSSMLDDLFPRQPSNSGKGLVKFDQHAAVAAFNEFGPRLGLKPLKLVKSDDAGPSSCENRDNNPRLPGEKKVTRRRTGIFKRVQSSLHLKVPTSPTQQRPLRRMRTFAHFPSRSHGMTSLKGRSLDSLTRLGGHSFLNLPAEFAPSTLRLPVCFVATATYLKVFAPAVRHLFHDPGDLKTAARTYDYFAQQVLSADREQGRIELTLRGSEMPIDLVDVLNQEAPGQNVSQVLGVAWAFKALLSGLPGGILGSTELHCVLVDIYYKHAGGIIGRDTCSDERLLPGRGAKSTAIGLAILALTRPLQYNLICAVFGLGALLLQEMGRSAELAKHEVGGGDTSTLMTPESLGRILGPLLTGHEPKDEQDMFRAIELEIESQRVAVMMVDGWVEVSRRLRRWQSRGLPGERRGCSLQSRRTASSDDTG
ncbi:hypothetical protein P170DRAFT_468042 [Aspergillus steynii IBT 23096]|uniref:Rho-GAP domain-containing protein n=1 Tax=Aspergillus steynii IBT 23096 TaxID=1392250 RepID=A0A2I2FUM4_9EURO|nr:uncharacterized protein P170DRAFT_468042 [Aspergillus steynii IBT 23096]PLB44340.1 hypothetical protein P170DRAFT_468042 [Aspergillus steynii IBT 23096]